MAPRSVRLLVPVLWALLLLLSNAQEQEQGTQPTEVVEIERYLESSPGVPPGSTISCERIRVPGVSRLRNPLKFANSMRLTVAPPVSQVYSKKIHICVHENSTLSSCQCAKENWKTLEKGSQTYLKSPFQTKYVDVRVVDSYVPTDSSVTVTVKEEFGLYRVLFFVLGVALLVTAPVVSAWVPFYYSSAMTMGILLVILILLYQGMKLLPTGRKSTLYLIVYGSVVGLGTVLIKHIANILAPLLYELGMGEDMQKPFAVFCVLGIILLGAYLGYLGVRKFVLTSDGDVDIGTAKFVKWALRLVGAVLLLLSSLDPVFSTLGLLFGILVSLTPTTIFENLEFPFELSWPSRNAGFDGWRYKKHVKLWRKKQAASSPYGPSSSAYHTPVTISGKRVFVSPPSRYKMSPEQTFYSSYHRTPERTKMSKAEWEAVSRDCTLSSMQSLVSSPKFTDWVVDNADRISVMPHVGREERSLDEIERTADMQ